ncbi:glycosyl hydrolase family 28 protein [Clostridium hydrogenum]|uniref:glycosyl hydrolase family 28 protein n=1 Tax=Clostridium hydrogenum TaxID=2855764 RepID=UPI001F3263FD|nr:glycoside hydrolase family 28 protein [Clostridium hydrogenum]
MTNRQKTKLIISIAAVFISSYTMSAYKINAETLPSNSTGKIISIAKAAVASAATTDNNLAVSVIAHDNSTVTLAWQKPADYSNIADYNVYMNGKLIGSANNNKASSAKQFIDNFYNDSSNSSAVKINMHNYIATGLTPDTSYSFVVEAVDSNGNVITKSDAITQNTDKALTVLNVTDYGAVGDGTTLDTNAIQAAINACPQGGEVLIPAGKTFKTGALWLKDNMTLRVDGEILGSENPQDYISSNHPVAKGSPNNALINAVGTSSVQSLRIIGNGTIDGSGWKQDTPVDGLPVSLKSSIATVTQNGILAANQYNLALKEGLSKTAAYSTRSNLLSISKVNNVYLGDGLSFENPSRHTIGTSSCNNMVINGALVKTYDCNNADGIDFTAQGLIVMNSVFDTGDDDVNFAAGRGLEGEKKSSPVSDVWIFNNYFAHGHGAVVAGSYTAAEIENILAEDNVLNGTGSGLRCKSAKGVGGGAQNIYFRDSALKNITDGEGEPFIFTSDYSDSGSVGGFTPAPDLPIFKHIFVSNCSVNGSKNYGIFVDGLEGGEHTDIHFTNVAFLDTEGASINYMTNSSFTNVTFNRSSAHNDPKSPWNITNSTNVNVDSLINNQVVAPDKTWTIHFDQEVNFDDTTKQAIAVLDNNGNKVPVNLSLGQDSKSIVVSAPQNGYEAGEKYKLIVGSGVHSSANNEDLSKPVELDFSIEGTN